MATTVYDVETIALQDGKEVSLRPLAIGKLRRFMKIWEQFKDIDSSDEEAQLTIFVGCSGIVIEDSFKEEFDKTRDPDKGITDEYREYLEDVLDMDTIYKIIEVGANIKLNDPKLMVQAAEIAASQQEDGKN